MNIDELRGKLEYLGIPKTVYSFHGDGIGECFVIVHEAKGWLVYYSERGQRNGVNIFDTENEACDFLLNWILSDRTVQKNIT